MALVWWEKTVEYMFICILVQKKLYTFAPLDGDLERVGDAILKFNGKWLLIEFKRDRAALKTEESKFTNYQAAKDVLSGNDQHHRLVFGTTNDDQLGCAECTYFSRESHGIEGMLKYGIGLVDFHRHIKVFTKHKTAKPGSVGGFGLDSYFVAAGVNSAGQVVHLLDTDEFEHTMTRSRYLEREKKKQRDRNDIEIGR